MRRPLTRLVVLLWSALASGSDATAQQPTLAVAPMAEDDRIRFIVVEDYLSRHIPPSPRWLLSVEGRAPAKDLVAALQEKWSGLGSVDPKAQNVPVLELDALSRDGNVTNVRVTQNPGSPMGTCSFTYVITREPVLRIVDRKLTCTMTIY